MAHPRILMTALLALSLSVAGCAGIQTTEAPIAPGSQEGAINFFENEHGNLTIRIVDNRPYAAQSIYEAETYNALLFQLTNTTKLKAPMRKAVANTGRSYSMAFSNLPSDSQARYALSVGAFRNVINQTDVADPAFESLDQKVGEGISANFTLNPGENKTVTITVNAVGDMIFSSTSFHLDYGTPSFLSAATDITMRVYNLNSTKNPGAEEIRTYFKDAGGQLVADTTVTAPLPATGDGSVTLKVPTVAAAQNFTVVTDLASGSTVLSRRMRTVTVEPGASVNLNTNGGEF
ncbi:hypothetical protein D3C86_423930 [compost metagenome]